MADRQYSSRVPHIPVPGIDLTRSGVYCITSTIDGRRYVGSTTIGFMRRWQNHMSTLRRGAHRNRLLQAVWNKHGEGVFVFSVLRFCEPSESAVHEQAFIDHMQSSERGLGFNLTPFAVVTVGYRASSETRQLLSQMRRGVKRKPLSDETKEKIAARHRGKKFSPERCLQQSIARKGIKRGPCPEERKAKIAKSHIGKKHSVEAKLKMSASRRARTLSAECRALMSIGLLHRSAAKHKPVPGHLEFSFE